MNAKKRLAIAQETLDILAAGQYKNAKNEWVDLRADLKNSVDNTILYKPEDFQQVFALRASQLKTNPADECTIEVTAESTFTATKRLVAAGNNNICCLNFASAKNPGGGFLRGTQAQEETLARGSGLYASLITKMEMYQTNRSNGSCLYTDNMIYSPLVPVFRDEHDQLMDHYYSVSIITSPAVNAGALQTNEPDRIKEIAPVMINRMEKLLSIAVAQGQTTLILGAWGCGVFRNNTKDVAAWFAHHLLENELFKNAFSHVVFAVYDNTEKQETLHAFKAQFEKARLS
jgi:uncharacterized protein (TIGR02452 family)